VGLENLGFGKEENGLILNTLLIVRILILLMALIAFYRLFASTHLAKKITAWAVFQVSIVLLWLSASSHYHGQENPIPQVVAFLIGIFSIGILGIMLIFALGVLRRQGSLQIENNDTKRPA